MTIPIAHKCLTVLDTLKSVVLKTAITWNVTLLDISLQMPDCNCNGWKTPMNQQPGKSNPRADNQPLASFNDPCRNCNHILGKKLNYI